MDVKIVLDTNVLISGVFFGGTPGKILNVWRKGKVQLFVSPEIFEEYEEVCHELAARYPGINVGPLLNLIKKYAHWLNPSSMDVPSCDDLSDVKFLQCAIEGHVDFIVSGDKHLLRLNGYKNLKIFRPSEFVNHHFH